MAAATKMLRLPHLGYKNRETLITGTSSTALRNGLQAHLAEEKLMETSPGARSASLTSSGKFRLLREPSHGLLEEFSQIILSHFESRTEI